MITGIMALLPFEEPWVASKKCKRVNIIKLDVCKLRRKSCASADLQDQCSCRRIALHFIT